MYDEQHSSPFEFAIFEVEMEVPIFILKMFVRHRTFAFSEWSGRYTTMPDRYYLPSIQRIGGLNPHNKQGTGELLSKASRMEAVAEIGAITEQARLAYDRLIAMGVAYETARILLPLTQYTRTRMIGNLKNWFHFLHLRQDDHAQWEATQYADAISSLCQRTFPRCHALYEEYDRFGARLGKTELETIKALLPKDAVLPAKLRRKLGLLP
jgi:thymidylate synthase (FAD)